MPKLLILLPTKYIQYIPFLSSKGFCLPARNGLKPYQCFNQNVLVVFRAKMVIGQEHVLIPTPVFWCHRDPRKAHQQVSPEVEE